MKVFLKEGFTFTPEWNDNKKQKKEDQITVEMEFLSGATVFGAIGEDGAVDLLKDWLLICKKVNNLNVNGADVTPEDVYSTKGLEMLFVELKLAYKKETAIDKKKL